MPALSVWMGFWEVESPIRTGEAGNPRAVRSRSSAPHGAAQRALELYFLLHGKRPRSLVAPACLLVCSVAASAKFGWLFLICLEGFLFFFMLWSDAASFHGHKHFPASPQFGGFAVYGPAEPCCP